MLCELARTFDDNSPVDSGVRYHNTHPELESSDFDNIVLKKTRRGKQKRELTSVLPDNVKEHLAAYLWQQTPGQA